MAACKHKMGLLSLQNCGQVAYHQCCHCHKEVCEDHSQSTAEGICCLTCSAKATPNVDIHDERLNRIRRRRHYYDQFGYYPYWHHGYHYNDFDRDANQVEAMGASYVAGPIEEVLGDADADADDSGDVIDANDFQDS